MPSKKPATTETDFVLDENKRREILKILYDKVDSEPPVGERYEALLRMAIRSACDEALGNQGKARRAELEEEIFNYVASYGPIQPFLDDPDVSEIMVNGPNQVYIERFGDLIETDVTYDDARQVRFAINHIINPTGRFVNVLHPTVDSRLPDGSRVNIVVPPVSQQGPCITIRKFLKDKLSLDQLIALNSLTEQMAEFLRMCVRGRLNIIVAGNTSSGKTTLLNILAGYIPESERIVTIEDSAELALQQSHKLSLEAQPQDYRGMGGVSVRDLVKNSLRMRPDRIILGEVRGGEAIDMLQAMNTGHDGSMATIHSNSARDTISRLETTALMAGIDLPVIAIRRQIASALDLIVYLNRLSDGSRKITQIAEVVGMEGEIVSLTDIFMFEQTGVDQAGKIKGRFRPTGLRPMFSTTLEAQGHRLEASLFRQTQF
jgi:pilus assembly protein CpaF